MSWAHNSEQLKIRPRIVVAQIIRLMHVPISEAGASKVIFMQIMLMTRGSKLNFNPVIKATARFLLNPSRPTGRTVTSAFAPIDS